VKEEREILRAARDACWVSKRLAREFGLRPCAVFLIFFDIFFILIDVFSFF